MEAKNLNSGRRARVLFLASEVFPLAKTGGLADVCGALPTTLARQGVDIRIMLPGYPQALDMATRGHVVCDLSEALGIAGSRLVAGFMPGLDIPVYLFDCPPLFRRNGGLYQDANGQEWRDNHRRFAAFCRAAASVALGETPLDWQPDIVHAHDWHTGPVAPLLRYSGKARPKSVFTIHNLAFQGNFPLETFPALGLPPDALSPEGIEFYGKISFLKAGIRYGDRLTTVSPNYAREIMTPEHGCGLDGLLRSRAADLVGILNGVDYSIWDPGNDAELPQHYSAEDLSGKHACKEGLRQEIGLEGDPGRPLMIYVNRLTHQKMADVVLEAVPQLVAEGAQLVVHGEGDRELEAGFLAAARRHPDHVSVRIGYREALAHRLTAGADISLTPSRFEPCGLTTMYAMRYGALPVTRPVGGLADTVKDAGTHNDAAEDGTGFMFADTTAAELSGCIRRALTWYGDDQRWQQLQRQAMRRDFAWERSAQRYCELYASLVPAMERKEDDEIPAVAAE
jgi:starch synthase